MRQDTRSLQIESLTELYKLLEGFFSPSYTSGFSFHFCVETSNIYFVLRRSAYSASVVIFQIYTLGLKWKYHLVYLNYSYEQKHFKKDSNKNL
jgi:hypothetical protein